MILRPGVDALDRVGRVDHPAYRRREREERDHSVPGAAPCDHDGGELAAPETLLEGVQFGLRGLGAGRRVDGLDRPPSLGRALTGNGSRLRPWRMTCRRSSGCERSDAIAVRSTESCSDPKLCRGLGACTVSQLSFSDPELARGLPRRDGASHLLSYRKASALPRLQCVRWHLARYVVEVLVCVGRAFAPWRSCSSPMRLVQGKGAAFDPDHWRLEGRSQRSG